MTDIINNLSNKKRVFIKTYGCQMNVYDSERMTDALSGHGYEPTNDITDADLVLLNTCHIREKAAEKVYSELGRIRDMRNERGPDAKKMLIGVAGCVAQAEGDEIMRRSPAVDLVFGPQSYHRLPQMVEQAHTTRVIDTDFTNEDKFEHLPLPSREITMKRGLTAFLTVQEGCDKFCSFCVVPYTRGAEISRPVSQVLQEARVLAAGGVREVTLLGQNVNAYHGLNEHGRSVSLGELCYMLAEIEGIDRIRYTTSHPRDMDDGLIEAHRNLDKLMPFLHLPVQSGSDAMLKAMNRRHTRAEYIEIIERIKDARPDMSLSSDFIIGFPGETDRDFQDTVDLVKQIGYSAAYSFKYSMRPGTPGAEMTNQIEEHVKTERLEILQAVIQEEQDKFNLSCVGKTLSVLLEKPGKLTGQIAGRSPYLQPIHLEADPALIGQIRPVTIISAKRGSIHGRLAQ